MTTLVHNARLLTMGAGIGPRRGAAAATCAAIPRGWVRFDDRRILETGIGDAPRPLARDVEEDIDAGGRILMPGFVDCHTHACWAGERYAEWEQRLRGATYLELLAAGGGILSTVRATRATPTDTLRDDLVRRVARMRALGTTTVEVKSGYGLDAHTELRMLDAIRDAQRLSDVQIVPTALLGHAIDPDAPDAVDAMIALVEGPLVERFPGVAVDAYGETGAWSPDACLRLFDAAIRAGHPVRVHTDQFHSLGLTEAAIDRGARTVDHLEASTPDTLRRVARSETLAVLLPGCGFHLDDRYADARTLLDEGAAVCLATNLNPGSSPLWGLPSVIALAVRRLRMTIDEALIASTVNAAHALGLDDRGVLRVGARADLLLLHHRDERAIAWEVGASPVDRLWIARTPTA